MVLHIEWWCSVPFWANYLILILLNAKDVWSMDCQRRLVASWVWLLAKRPCPDRWCCCNASPASLALQLCARSSICSVSTLHCPWTDRYGIKIKRALSACCEFLLLQAARWPRLSGDGYIAAARLAAAWVAGGVSLLSASWHEHGCCYLIIVLLTPQARKWQPMKV